MQPPIDFQSFLNLVASQAFIGTLITWLIEHIPFMQDAKVANWKKLTFAILVCILWVLISTIIQQGSLPQTANGVYMMLMTAVAVVFTNQAAYKLIDSIPGLRDFVLAFSKVPTISGTSTLTSGYITGASIKTTTKVEQPTQPQLNANVEKLAGALSNALFGGSVEPGVHG